MPNFLVWALPTCEDCLFQDRDFCSLCIEENHLIFVIDDGVSCLGKFVGAEEGISTSAETMLTLHAGSRMLCRSLFLVVAGAIAPSGR